MPHASQPPTYLSIGAIAAVLGRWTPTSERWGKTSSSVSSQERPSIADIGFVLATVHQVSSARFVNEFRIGLFVSVLGMHSRQPRYPAGVPYVNFAVTWQGGRNQKLMECLPKVVTALSQGLNVAVHCLHSFHRGPAGLAAILRALFGFDVKAVLKLISRNRDVNLPYAAGEEIGGSLGSAVNWAARLELWQPPRPAGAASSQGAASSSGAGSNSAAGSGHAWAEMSALSREEKQRQLENDRGYYLYRAMATDGKDLNASQAASSRYMEGEQLLKAIFDGIATGSKTPSAFLHFSWSFTEARNWHSRGKMLRGEKNGYMTRVRVKDLEELAAHCTNVLASKRAALSQEQPQEPFAVLGKIFDLSSSRSQMKVFSRFGRENFVMDRVEVLGIAVNHKEVLVPWRGYVPEAIFEKIDPDSGLSLIHI